MRSMLISNREKMSGSSMLSLLKSFCLSLCEHPLAANIASWYLHAGCFCVKLT
jgi:hypothetical protein